MRPDIRAVAHNYMERGYSPIPIPFKTKGPVLKGWQSMRVRPEEVLNLFDPCGNIGLLLGEPSGGLVDVDVDCPEARALVEKFLPWTGMVHGRRSNPRSHFWYLVDDVPRTKRYQDSERERSKDGKDANAGTIVELRATGGQTLVPPSIHPSGERVRWEPRIGGPTQVPIATLIEKVEMLAAGALLVRYWPAKGMRHDFALALAGALLRGGWQEDLAASFIENVAQAAGDEEAEKRSTVVRYTSEKLKHNEPTTGLPRLADMLGEPGAHKIRGWLRLRADSVGAVSAPPGAKNFALTDLGNAERFAARHHEHMRFVGGRGGWHVWDGRRWSYDETQETKRLAAETVRSIYTDVTEALTENERRDLAHHAIKSESAGRIEAMLRLGTSQSSIVLRACDLDKDPWLLNCNNGTLNLSTGELRGHRRDDFITKLAFAKYDPAAGCPTWERFLERVLPSPDVRSFLQRALGYSLTGDTSEHCIFILYGTGANGKSTCLETVRSIIGNYSRLADSSTFLAKKNDHVPNDVAALVGARFVTVSETEGGSRLAAALVKNVTGGDTVTARFLYKEFFEFKPEFKLWLATNHKPVVTDSSEGFWRRIKLVPFEVQIPAAERDKQLAIKLRGEAPGILRWMVEGCLEWQKNGLGEPTEVLDATEAYREQEDPVGSFIQECCVMDDGTRTSTNALHQGYCSWARRVGENLVSSEELGRALSARGLKRGKIGGKRGWLGIRLGAGR